MRFCGRDKTFQAGLEVGKKTPRLVRGNIQHGRREHQRWFQLVVVGDVDSLSHAPKRSPTDRGRRVLIEGMWLQVALFPRWRPDDEDWEQLIFVDGITRLERLNPVSHPPHEPPLDSQ